jgi:hypothetical protein
MTGLTKICISIAILITGVIILSSCSKEPDNFDDCILEHIKSGQSDKAVSYIRRACKSKFPPKP